MFSVSPVHRSHGFCCFPHCSLVTWYSLWSEPTPSSVNRICAQPSFSCLFFPTVLYSPAAVVPNTLGKLAKKRLLKCRPSGFVYVFVVMFLHTCIRVNHAYSGGTDSKHCTFYCLPIVHVTSQWHKATRRIVHSSSSAGLLGRFSLINYGLCLQMGCFTVGDVN